MATAAKKTTRQGVQEPAQAPIVTPDGQPPARVAIAPQADHRPPHLTAAQSHLDVAPNPLPEVPGLDGVWGTGGVAAIDRLENALHAKDLAGAKAVDVLRMPAVVGNYKAEVVAWIERELAS